MSHVDFNLNCFHKTPVAVVLGRTRQRQRQRQICRICRIGGRLSFKNWIKGDHPCPVWHLWLSFALTWHIWLSFELFMFSMCWVCCIWPRRRMFRNDFIWQKNLRGSIFVIEFWWFEFWSKRIRWIGFCSQNNFIWKLKNKFTILVWLKKAFGDLSFAQKRIFVICFCSKKVIKKINWKKKKK